MRFVVLASLLPVTMAFIPTAPRARSSIMTMKATEDGNKAMRVASNWLGKAAGVFTTLALTPMISSNGPAFAAEKTSMQRFVANEPQGGQSGGFSKELSYDGREGKSNRYPADKKGYPGSVREPAAAQNSGQKGIRNTYPKRGEDFSAEDRAAGGVQPGRRPVSEAPPSRQNSISFNRQAGSAFYLAVEPQESQQSGFANNNAKGKQSGENSAQKQVVARKGRYSAGKGIGDMQSGKRDSIGANFLGSNPFGTKNEGKTRLPLNKPAEKMP